MKNLFVPYEIRELAEANGIMPIKVIGSIGATIEGITYQHIVDWFREEHEIYINVVREPIGSDEWELSYEINYLPNDKKHVKRRGPEFIWIRSFSCNGSTYWGAWSSYYEAFNEALKKSFKLLTP